MNSPKSAPALQWTSWNSRIQHPYQTISKPSSLDELCRVVQEAPSLRVLGTGKSSADICAGTPVLVSMEGLSKILSTGSFKDAQGKTVHYVQAEAGIMLKDLLEYLEAQGLGFEALPDIDAITLGGALATGTHGTGKNAQSLSDYLIGCTLVSASGEAVHSGFRPESPVPADTKAGPDLDALKVSLGLLGVMYAPILEVSPLFSIALEEQAMANPDWESQWQSWEEDFDFTRILFLPHTGFGWTILGRKYSGEPPFAPIPAPTHHKNRRKTSQRFYRWFSRFPSLSAWANRILKDRFFSGLQRKLGTLWQATVTHSRAGTMVLAEWAIPFERFPACFGELRNALEDPGNPAGAHIPMDVRFYRKSRAWLSNAWEADTVSLGCVCRVPEAAHRYRAFDHIEAIFLKHGGRPHWAKHFKSDRATLEKLYPRYQDFVALRRTWDPTGKFLNAWLKGYFE